MALGEMPLVPLGTSGLITSQLGMGCAKLGSASAGHTRRQATRLVEHAFACGIRLFDTADAYGSGSSESILGGALRRHRDEVVIATKVGYRFRERSNAERVARRLVGSTMGAVAAARHRRGAGPDEARPTTGAYAEHDFSSSYVRSAVVASLRRLHTDRIDLLQFHGPPPDPVDGLPEVVTGLIDDGLVRSFGIGCERLDTAASWVDVPGLACIQLPFGVLDPQAAASIIPRARARGVGVLVRGVLGGGILAGFVRGLPVGLDPVRQARVERLAALATELGVDLLQVAVWYGLRAGGADAMLLGITADEQADANVAMVLAEPASAGVLDQIRVIVEHEEL